MLDFSHGGILKFKYKDRSLTVEKACEILLDWKSERLDHASKPYLHTQKTSKISNFGEFSKFLRAN